MFIRRYATSATRARGFLATGGTIFEHEGMRVHRFTGNGTFTVRRGSAEVEVLLVGTGTNGGGIGHGIYGTWADGARGGHGGEVRIGTAHVSPGQHPVKVAHRDEIGPQVRTEFAGLSAGRSPHNIGTPVDWHGIGGARYLHGGGGPSLSSNGGDAVAGQSGRAGHGAAGITINWWGENVHVGAGGGGGVHRLSGTAAYASPGNGGNGAGNGGDYGQPGGNATGYGNGGGGAGGIYPQSGSPQVGAPGLATNGLVVIRYPLELLEGP